jgi:hypothetical protein
VNIIEMIEFELNKLTTYSQDLDMSLIPDKKGDWVDIREVFRAIEKARRATSKILPKIDMDKDNV